MQKKISRVTRIGFFLGIPLIFALIPWDVLSRSPVICPFRRFLGFPCLGCGMTRAFWLILHGRFAAAFHYNQLALPVLLIFIYCAAKDLHQIITAWAGRRTGNENYGEVER